MDALPIDPSVRAGNRNIGATRATAAVVAALALAGCSGSVSIDSRPANKAPTTTTSTPDTITPPQTTPTLPEQDQQALLNAKAQTVAGSLAGRILTQFQEGRGVHNLVIGNNGVTKTEAVIIGYPATSTNKDSVGEYTLTAAMELDANGKPDPAKVDSVSILAGVTNPELSNGGEQTLFYLSLTKDYQSPDWSITTTQNTSDSLNPLPARYDTSVPMGKGELSPIDTGLFDALIVQGYKVYDRAVEEIPVPIDPANFVPPAGK